MEPRTLFYEGVKACFLGKKKATAGSGPMQTERQLEFGCGPATRWIMMALTIWASVEQATDEVKYP